MKRRRAALVGGVRIRPVIEQYFNNGKIPRAHSLMHRCDRITVPGIDGRASLDEQRRDARGLPTIRAPKVGDAVKRCLAKSIGYENVRTPIEEVFDDLAVQRLGGVQEQRRPVLVDDEIGLCDSATVAKIYGRDNGDCGARAAEETHDLVPSPRRRVSDRRELRATRVYVGAPVEELPYKPCVAVLRGHRQCPSVPTILSVRVDARDEAGDGRCVPLPDGLAEFGHPVHVAQADSTRLRPSCGPGVR